MITGSNAEWHGLDFHFNTTEKLLKRESMAVEVFDENSARSHTAIGSNQFQISSAVNPGVERGHEREVRSYVGIISQIRVTELKNVELSGENDPFVTMRFGLWQDKVIRFSLFSADHLSPSSLSSFFSLLLSLWHDKTEYQDGAGHEAIWENTKFTFTATDISMEAEVMIIEAWDYNSYRSHQFIGEGKVNLVDIQDRLGESMDYSITLTDKCGQKTGEAVITITINAAFDITFSKITCDGLKNVEMFGKNDPYVVLTLGGWRYQTRYQDDAGSKCEWTNSTTDIGTSRSIIDLCCMVNKEMILSEELVVEVFDYNDINAHAIIGTGKCSLGKYLTEVSETSDNTVIINLVNKKNRQTGTVRLFFRITETPIIFPPQLGEEISITFDIMNKKGAKTGVTSVHLKAGYAKQRMMTTVDHKDDPVFHIDEYMRCQPGQHRLEAFACEFSQPMALRACLELAKNEQFKYSLLQGQPLVVFRIALECFTSAKEAETLADLDPNSRTFSVVNDGLVYELTEAVSFCVDILLHLMCYVELMGLHPITKDSINTDMQKRIKGARDILKEKRDVATNDGERRKAKAEFEIRAARAKADYSRQLARIEREGLWWQMYARVPFSTGAHKDENGNELSKAEMKMREDAFKSSGQEWSCSVCKYKNPPSFLTCGEYSALMAKKKVCGDMHDTISTMLQGQRSLKETNSKKFLLPPETFRHLGYLQSLLQRGRDGMIVRSIKGLELSLPKLLILEPRIKTRCAIAFVHSEDRDSRYLSRKELRVLAKEKVGKLRANKVDDNDDAEAEPEDTSDMTLAELLNAQKTDGRVSDLVHCLLKANIEVIVDKGSYPLKIMEKLSFFGYDPEFPLLRSETLTMEMLSTCAALIMCVTTPTQNHPGARYVSGKFISLFLFP